MAKKFTSILVALAVVVTMTFIPITSFATTESETAYVAKVGDKSYATVEGAYEAAAKGDTITLQKDTELDATLNLEKDVTLDLNGHKISNSAKLSSYMINVTGSDVTIKGDKDGSQIADSRTNEVGTITAIRVLGKLTVDGTNLKITRGGGIAIKVDEGTAQGELIINGGTIQAKQALQNWGITEINGGAFKGIVDSYAYGNIAGKITVNDGTFEGEVYAAQLKYSGNWPKVSAKIDIKGGTFKKKISEYYDDGTNGTQPIERLENKPDNIVESEVNISDGIFSEDPTEYIDEIKYEVAHDADKDVYTIVGRQAVSVTHDGTATKYNGMDDAVNAAKAGDTITLIKDTTIDPKYYNNGTANRLNVNEDNITIDLNGKTLTTPNCALTLCGDGIVLKNGTMVATPTSQGQTFGSYVTQIKGKNVVVKDLTTIGGINVSGYNSDNPDNPDATVTITNCNITAGTYYTVCAQRNSEAVVKNSTLIGGKGAFFWVEAKDYKEGDANPANFDAKLSYEKSTVTLVGNNTLYNTVGVAPIAFCTVTVDPRNGDDATVETVNDGATLSLKEPTREGYTFKGWYNDGKVWTDGSKITGNMTIVAYWEKNKSDEDTKIDTKTDTKTETKDGSTVTTITETVTEKAKDGSETKTVAEDITKTNADGTKEKVNTATETKTDKNGDVTETKSETVTKTDAQGNTTSTVETKAEVKATTVDNKTTEEKTETVITKDADGNVTETVKTDATVEKTENVTTTEQTVTTTDKDNKTVVETTKTIEDKTNNVAIETKVSSNTAKTEAKIANTEETLPTTVIVDATAAKADVKDVTKTEVTLPAATVAAIKDAATAESVETVEVKTDVATLEIDNTALQTLTKATGEEANQSLVLTVAKTDSTVEKTDNAKATFELTAVLKSNDGNETPVFDGTDAENNGTIKVNVAYTPEKADNTIKVYYVAENGEKTEMKASYEDGVLSWDTNHFSTYEVVEVAKADPTPNPDDNGKGKTDKKTTTKTVKKTVSKAGESASTGDTAQVAPWMALVLISGTALIAVAVIGRRKSHNK